MTPKTDPTSELTHGRLVELGEEFRRSLAADPGPRLDELLRAAQRRPSRSERQGPRRWLPAIVGAAVVCASLVATVVAVTVGGHHSDSPPPQASCVAPRLTVSSGHQTTSTRGRLDPGKTLRVAAGSDLTVKGEGYLAACGDDGSGHVGATLSMDSVTLTMSDSSGWTKRRAVDLDTNGSFATRLRLPQRAGGAIAVTDNLGRVVNLKVE